MNSNEILGRLRSLGACGDAVRPGPNAEGDTGWVVLALQGGATLGDLWHTAVTEYLVDAWWLVETLRVSRPAEISALRRALTYLAVLAEDEGLDDTELRQVAGTEVLDLALAETAVRALADASSSATRAAVAAHRSHPPVDVVAGLFDLSDRAREVARAIAANHVRFAGTASRIARNISTKTEVGEYNRQREDLFALSPAVEDVFSALEGWVAGTDLP